MAALELLKVFYKVLQTLHGEKALGVDWIYSSFIEAPGEKGAASTGIAIGANTGKTTAGQVGIITAEHGCKFKCCSCYL